MSLRSITAAVLRDAISLVRERGIPVFTFALYFHHESEAISVCVDTEENSSRVVRSINNHNRQYFEQAVAAGDLPMAQLWHANTGRSLSLGNFVLVNVARREVPGVEQTDLLFAELVRALLAVEAEVASLSPSPESLVFACSSATQEVGFLWSVASVA